MKTKSLKKLSLIIIALWLLISMACSMDSSNVNPVQLTELAKVQLHQTETVIAAKVRTEIAAAQSPTPPPAQPTYTPQPTYTFLPTQPIPDTPVPPAQPPPPAFAPTSAPADSFSVQIEKSTDKFFCNYEPGKVTFTLTVNKIEPGFAIYYRFVDMATKQETPRQKADIHRDSAETYRFINFVGDPNVALDYHSVTAFVSPGMGPSYMTYEIIADDGSYRSEKKSDVIFYPCDYFIN